MTKLKTPQYPELEHQNKALSVYLSSLLDEPPENYVTEKTDSPTKWTKAYPEWAENNLKFLSITVAGMHVLIPTTMINNIKNVTAHIKPSLHMPSWVYDYDDGSDKNTQIINTQKLIFDGLRSQRLKLKQQTYAILIDKGTWGIACDSIGKIIPITRNNISWSGKKAKRRWLAGTSTTHNAIIFDVHHIEKVLVRFT